MEGKEEQSWHSFAHPDLALILLAPKEVPAVMAVLSVTPARLEED